MQDNEMEEGGISLGDIFRTIFSQKWLALIIAVVITVLGTCGLYFIGRLKQDYSVTFVMQLPGSGNSPMSYTYPDGTRFHFTELISAENLAKVKEDSGKKEIDEFADIDIEKMLRQGDISIIRELIETAQGSGTYEANYTINVKTSYFKSKDIARDFIIALVKLPADYLAEMQISYDAYLSSAADALTYDDQISFLRSQANYIGAQYDAFINTYGGSFIVENGKMLTSYRSAIDVFITNGEFERLKNEAIQNGYIRSDDVLDEYRSKLFDKERQVKREQVALDNLLSLNPDSQSSLVIDADKIVSQTLVVQQLNQDIDDLKNYIETKKVNKDFDGAVENLEANVSKFTDEFKKVATKVYSTATTINYSSVNVITTEGGKGLMTSALISLVIGVVLAAVVAYIVGWSKNKKAAKTDVSVPVYMEAQAQAAVTKDEEESKEDK